MNCGVRHYGNDVMQLSYCHASIWASFYLNFVKKVVTDQRWPITPFFVVNIIPSCGEFTAPFRHILQIHNVTINSNSLFVNFRWTFTYCVENGNKSCVDSNLFLCSVLSCTYCKHSMNFQLCTTMKKWYQLWKKKSKIGSRNPRRQRLTFIVSVYTHLLSTWRAVCDISVNFLWIIFIAVCILVPRSNDSHNHTTLETKNSL